LAYLSGCDRGFGQALAKELDNIGADVFAGCLCTNSDGAKELLASCSERCATCLHFELSSCTNTHD